MESIIAVPDPTDPESYPARTGGTKVTRAAMVSDAELAEALCLDDESLRTYIAMHEAGHVVAGVAAGVPVLSAHLAESETEPLPGYVEIGPYEEPITLDDALVLRAAGEQAALRWLKETGRTTPERERLTADLAAQDRQAVADLLAGCGMTADFGDSDGHGGGDGDGPVVSYKKHCLRQADALLGAYWTVVHEVAAALAHTGHLTDDRIEELTAPVRWQMRGREEFEASHGPARTWPAWMWEEYANTQQARRAGIVPAPPGEVDPADDQDAGELADAGQGEEMPCVLAMSGGRDAARELAEALERNTRKQAEAEKAAARLAETQNKARAAGGAR